MRRQNLINFRKSKHMTIREMARSLGVSKSYYEKIEYGERSPSYNFMRKFKDEYPNANVDFIL